MGQFDISLKTRFYNVPLPEQQVPDADTIAYWQHDRQFYDKQTLAVIVTWLEQMKRQNGHVDTRQSR